MASAFDSAGNTDLREYIQANWTHVAVVDDTGTEQVRYNVTADSQTEWSSGSGTNPLTATITVTGSDIQNAGGTLPVTLTRTESYKSASATTRMAGDPYTDATLEAPNDELTITHNIEVPQQ